MMGLSPTMAGDRPGAGRVGIGEGNAAERRAGADADDGRGALGRLAQGVHRAASAGRAVGAARSRRHRAVHHQHIFSEVVLHGLVARRFGGLAGRRHERVVIVQRDDVEDQVLDGRREGSGQRLEAPGALLERQIDDRRPGGALRSCSAIAGPIQGGSAMAEAAAVQNLMKLRRLMPCLSSISPTVSSSFRAASVSPCLLLARPRGAGRGDLLAQGRARAAAISSGALCENLRNPSHFEQLRDQLALAIAMLHPPDAGHARFPNGRESLRVHRRLHLARRRARARVRSGPCGLIGRLRRSIAAGCRSRRAARAG